MKDNKGVSLTGFVIAILVVLLIGAVVGCVYLLKNQNKGIMQTNETIFNLRNTIETNAKEEMNIAENKEMTADEKFLIYANGMKKVFQNLENGGVKYIEAFEENVDTSEYVGTYTLVSANDIKIDHQRNLYIKDKKVTSDVLNISKSLHAQNGNYIFIMKGDGALEYISENDYENSKYVSHQLEGFKNIVDVIGIQGVDYNKFLAIDIEGNSYEINI